MTYATWLIDGTFVSTQTAPCPLNQCSGNCQKPSCSRDVGYTTVADSIPRLERGDISVLCRKEVTVYLVGDTGPISYRYYSCSDAYKELIQLIEGLGGHSVFVPEKGREEKWRLRMIR